MGRCSLKAKTLQEGAGQMISFKRLFWINDIFLEEEEDEERPHEDNPFNPASSENIIVVHDVTESSGGGY